MIIRKRRKLRVWQEQGEKYCWSVGKKISWKFSNLAMSEEDFVQECFIVYNKCLEKYGTCLEPSGELSFRFRRSVNNLVCDISNRSLKESKNRDKGGIPISMVDPESNLGFFRAFLGEAPKEVKEVLKHIFDTPNEIMELLSIKHNRGFTNNELLCKALKYDKFKINLPRRLKEYLISFNLD